MLYPITITLCLYIGWQIGRLHVKQEWVEYDIETSKERRKLLEQIDYLKACNAKKSGKARKKKHRKVRSKYDSR